RTRVRSTCPGDVRDGCNGGHSNHHERRRRASPGDGERSQAVRERRAWPRERIQTRFMRALFRSFVRLWSHPYVGFVFVCGLLFLNQLFVNVYVRVVHHGDVAFVTRYLGPAWFHLATDAPPVVLVARLLGNGGAAYLAPSILRVQAFLELPFVLYAYLSIARSLDRALYVRLTHPIVLAVASVSFTLAFAYA